jgi:hypothetical protein
LESLLINASSEVIRNFEQQYKGVLIKGKVSCHLRRWMDKAASDTSCGPAAVCAVEAKPDSLTCIWINCLLTIVLFLGFL